MVEKILYEDKSITITNTHIFIRKYYVPLMTSKTILFSEMRKIRIEDASEVNTFWGTNGLLLNNWFNYDPQRKKKAKFISF